ncbi:MAG TPA: serine hydrolase [Steroidobacteraceae bacterium]|nr:serine hydrolase [Steroidobacteraceae bacterium]
MQTFLCLPVLLLAAVTATWAAPDPDVRSHAFYVLDPSESSVLAARHENDAMPIASITKLMTAIVVLEAAQPLDEVLTITADDVKGTRGGRSRLAQGANLTRGDMLHLALMSSENRTAHAVCRAYPGGLTACVEAMNEKAASLGMTATRFVEPTGLSSENVASPADLAKLVLASSRNPVIREYSTDPDQTVAVNGHPLEFRNTNLLVKKPEWQVSLQKTGYISEAGRCLVMEAVIDSREVVIVLLNSWGTLTRFADAKRIRNWLESQRRLAEI